MIKTKKEKNNMTSYDPDVADDPVPIQQCNTVKQFTISSLKHQTLDELDDDNQEPVEKKISYLNLYLDKPKQFKETVVIRSRILLSNLSVQDHPSFARSQQNWSIESLCKKSSYEVSNQLGSVKLIEKKIEEQKNKQHQLERKLSSMQKIQYGDRKSPQFGTQNDIDNQLKYSRQNIYIEKQCSIDHKSILKKDSSFSIDHRYDKVNKSYSKKKVRFGLTKVQIQNLAKVTKC